MYYTQPEKAEEIEKRFQLLISKCKSLNNDNSYMLLKCLIVYKLSVHLEEIWKCRNNNEPYSPMLDEIDRAINFMEAGKLANMVHDPNLNPLSGEIREIADRTQGLYGNLWVDFKPETFFDETFLRLKTRLERNNFDISWLYGKTVLDDGCGGGRYTVALAKLGCAKAVGVDLSEKGLPDARNRIKGTEFENKVEYRKANVLELPFEDEKFDFIFSNGVLHHTTDPLKGINECYRVLKGGGKIWLYMWGGGGLLNLYINAVREVLRDIPPAIMQTTMTMLGLPPNRRFYFMDFMFVPIRKTYTESQLKKIMEDVGFRDIVLFRRGFDTDTSELIYRKVPFARDIYGEGDLRFLAEK